MKDKLQQELLEKVKPGMKPSDLKKQSQKQDKTPFSPPPMSITRSDDGYSSEGEKNTLTQTLQTQINSLQKQLQLYKDFKEADLKVKEKLKEDISKLQAENQTLNKTITNLQKQAKTPEKDKEPNELFTCSYCHQEWSPNFLKLIDPSGNKTCSDCLTNMLELTKAETGKEIILEEQETKPLIKPCQFCSKPYFQSELKPRHILNLPNHDPREITLLCQSCLTYRAKKADYYCPLTSEGKDTYEDNEFDCFCPTNERRTL